MLGPDRNAPVEIWSAACSTGEEAYSLATLLYSIAGSGNPGVRVLGTDIDRDAIRTASYGSYEKLTPTALPQVPWAQYFIDRPYSIEPWHILRHMVEFMPLDILSNSAQPCLADIFPNGCDIIFCRNILIYMNREAQATILDLCAKMLKPNGLLVLGCGETVPRHTSLALEVLNSRARIFRKTTRREALPCSADLPSESS
jgi:chemotaxis methyl-accepting protein methylase